jgi:CRP-like cAMP-binding protein
LATTAVRESGAGGRSPTSDPWPAATFLGRLDEPARQAVQSLGRAVRLPINSPMMRLGEPASGAFLLIEGCVKVYSNDNGREPLLAIRMGGDLVGEMGVLSGGPRTATVTSCTPVLARAIGADELRGFLARDARAAYAVACMLAERLAWANQRRVDFVASDATTRVCRVLVALAQAYGRDRANGRDLGASLTQLEIASLAGVKLATAEKILRRLVQAELVRLGYRRVTVLDLPALRRWTESDDGDRHASFPTSTG